MYVLFESIFHLKNIYLFITSRQINSAQFGLVINIHKLRSSRTAAIGKVEWRSPAKILDWINLSRDSMMEISQTHENWFKGSTIISYLYHPFHNFKYFFNCPNRISLTLNIFWPTFRGRYILYGYNFKIHGLWTSYQHCGRILNRNNPKGVGRPIFSAYKHTNDLFLTRYSYRKFSWVYLTSC